MECGGKDRGLGTAALAMELAGERVLLDGRRALWWPEGRALFVADTHFGKDATARSQSIAIPAGVTASDLSRLTGLVGDYRPETLWILGDAFDSMAAAEAETLGAVQRWCRDRARCRVAMVPGNHDRHAGGLAAECGIEVHPNPTRTGPWRLAHEPGNGIGGHGLCGHLHPGVRLRATGRQQLRLPCFVLDPSETVLPAFSEFTGLAIQSPTQTRTFVAVADGRVVPLAPKNLPSIRAIQ